MTKPLVYTFRTCPYIADLQEIFPEVIVLGKLREDVGVLEQKIFTLKPEGIIGVAAGKRNVAEEFARNSFNHRGGIIRGGDHSLKLDNFPPFKSGNYAGVGFCNWAAYKVEYYLRHQQFDIPHSQLHLAKEGLERLIGLYP